MIPWIRKLVARNIGRRQLAAQMAVAEKVMREDRDVLRKLAQWARP